MLTPECITFYRHASPKDRFEVLTEEALIELRRIPSSKDRQLLINTMITSILSKYCECGATIDGDHECNQ